jgi:TonB dependent receptor-like, beta-barrel
VRRHRRDGRLHSNPISAAYITDIFSKLPLNDTGTLTTSFPGVFNYREELIRVDHLLTQKIALMGRFINDSIPTEEPYGLFGPQSSLPGVGNTKTNSPGRQIMGRATFQFNDRTFNEIGYAYSYGAITSDPTGLMARQNSPNVAAAVSLPYPVTLNRIPDLGFSDLSGLASFGQYRDYNRNHNAFDNFAWSKGTHSFRFGFAYNRYQKKENAAGNNVGAYNFDSTNAPTDDAAAAQNWANFLLGYASDSFTQSPVDTTADIRQNLYEAYGQDEWRIRPNFTISYGVRYSYFQTPYASSKNLTSFDPSVYSRAAAPAIDPITGQIVPNTGNVLNGLILGDSTSPYGRFITRQDKHNFAPRIGLAWDPFKDGKTSLRGGYGIFYDSVAAGLIEDNVFNNPPFISGASFGSLTNISLAGSTGALASPLPASVWTTDPRWNTPYSQQWNLDLQQELGRGFIFDVGYVGNKGTHLVGVWDINQVAPGVAEAAGYVLPGQPYRGIDAPGVPCTTDCPSSTTAARQLNALRPFLGWAQIGQIAPIFDSNYHALQTSVEKRFGSNTLINISYTWSHALTDNQSDRSSGLQNSYCKVCEYGRSTLDRRHVFTANYVWDLPWMRQAHGFTGGVLGGWQLAGILSVNSGLPLTVLTGRTIDPAASGLNVDGAPNNGRVATPRPNQIGNPNIDAPHTWDAWFNASAFVDPTTAQPFGGNERRGAVTGPGLWRYDMSLMKSFRITESSNIQFRAEAFNLFNHTNFNAIGTNTTSGLYNTVTSTRDPRTIQLALKFLF